MKSLQIFTIALLLISTAAFAGLFSSKKQYVCQTAQGTKGPTVLVMASGNDAKDTGTAISQCQRSSKQYTRAVKA